jgi:hypothetical protein
LKKASLVVSEYLKNNSIFDESGLHRDDIFDRFVELRKGFSERGYELSTDDINSIDESEFVIYSSNMPQVLPESKGKSFIILSESEFIRPDNYDKSKHEYFNKIFTWHDDYVDNKNYIKLNYAHKFPRSIKSGYQKRKLCHLISANKKPPHSAVNDLYSKRVEAIRWFEKHQPSDFDLFGVNWDKLAYSSNRLTRLMKKLTVLERLVNKLFFKEYPSYKGKVDNKKETTEGYRFSICFENAKDIPGYITEKIFDSFFAGCIPVYWGANNIQEYVPNDCYIDMRNFSSFEELYKHISNITEDQYNTYIDNIKKYLETDNAIQFTSKGFAQTIINTVLGDDNDNK